MKTLVAGIGNPILGDDGAGWAVARKVEEIQNGSHELLKIECYDLAGISLMEQMIGFERVILIDSLNTGKYAPGKVITFTLDDFVDPSFGHSSSAHDLSLKQALVLGRSMSANLPDCKNIHLIAIEARHVYEFGEILTPEIEAALPDAVQEVMKLLAQ